MSRNTIALCDLYKTFGGQTLLRGVTATFEQSFSCTIEGVSGTGKSTLLALMAGFEKPSSGTVLYNTKAITSNDVMGNTERIGFLFQQPRMIHELTVIENILLPTQLKKKNRAKAYLDACTLLEAVGLAHHQESMPTTLSGGELQRVAVARALINKPAFLLADEPTANLDRKSSTHLISLLKTLQKEWSLGLIISTHDPLVADAFDERYEIRNHLLSKK